MSKLKSRVEEVPAELSSYEEAAEFWDTHDTADYPEAFEAEPIELEAGLRQRHYEVEVDEELFGVLRQKARDTQTSVSRLVSTLLRRQLAVSS